MVDLDGFSFGDNPLFCAVMRRALVESKVHELQGYPATRDNLAQIEVRVIGALRYCMDQAKMEWPMVFGRFEVSAIQIVVTFDLVLRRAVIDAVPIVSRKL